MSANTPVGSERRKQLLVNKTLQGRMIGIIALFTVVSSVLFVILQMIAGPKQGPQSFISLLVNLLLVLILVLIGVVYTGLRFSQRIAGPIHHFGRQLGDIYQGNYTRELKFRKGDEFQNLAGAFNHAMGTLRDRVNDDIAFMDDISHRLETLHGDAAGVEAIKTSLREYRLKKESHLKKS